MAGPKKSAKKENSKPSTTITESFFSASDSFLDSADKFFKPKTQMQSRRNKKVPLDGSSLPIANIFFETDKFDLDANDQLVLDGIIAELSINLLDPNNKTELILEGFADYRGSEKQNKELSHFRAAAVGIYLNERLRKVSPNATVTVNGRGEQPKNKQLGEMRRVTIYANIPNKKHKKKIPIPKPKTVEFIEVPLPDDGPEPEPDPTKEELQDMDTIFNVGMSFLKAGISLAGTYLMTASAPVTAPAVAVGTGILVQIYGIINAVEVMGTDANAISAAVIGGSYGRVIMAYEAAKIYSMFKNDSKRPPSVRIKKAWVKPPPAPKGVMHTSIFQKAYRQQAMEFRKDAAIAFANLEQKRPKQELSFLEQRRRNNELQDFSNTTNFINVVSKDPDQVLHDTVEKALSETVGKSRPRYYKALFENVKFTYYFKKSL